MESSEDNITYPSVIAKAEAYVNGSPIPYKNPVRFDYRTQQEAEIFDRKDTFYGVWCLGQIETMKKLYNETGTVPKTHYTTPRPDNPSIPDVEREHLAHIYNDWKSTSFEQRAVYFDAGLDDRLQSGLHKEKLVTHYEKLASKLIMDNERDSGNAPPNTLEYMNSDLIPYYTLEGERIFETRRKEIARIDTLGVGDEWGIKDKIRTLDNEINNINKYCDEVQENGSPLNDPREEISSYMMELGECTILISIYKSILELINKSFPSKMEESVLATFNKYYDDIINIIADSQARNERFKTYFSNVGDENIVNNMKYSAHLAFNRYSFYEQATRKELKTDIRKTSQ